MHHRQRLLRTRDTAAYLGLAASTLEKLRVRGGGPPFVRRGRAVYYDLADLDAWIADMPRFASTAEADASEELVVD